MFGRIKAIGIEVEGIFKRPLKREGRLFDFHSEWLWPDKKKLPSLYAQGAYGLDKGGQEAVSEPLRNWEHVEEFFDLIEPHWDENSIAQGMGLHVHVSFARQKDYGICFSEKFAKQFYSELMKKFGHQKILRDRLAWRSEQGTNFYKTEYDPNYFKGKVDFYERSQRYYIINFVPAYRSHSTFEFRIFPANTIEKMKEYVDWTVQFVNRYIAKHEREYNEQTFHASIPLPKASVSRKSVKRVASITVPKVMTKLPKSIEATKAMTDSGTTIFFVYSDLSASKSDLSKPGERPVAFYELRAKTNGYYYKLFTY